MKRIEMIDEIMCCLLSYSATYPQYPLSQLKLVAEEILKMQEDKGMRPPLLLNQKYKGPLEGWEPEE